MHEKPDTRMGSNSAPPGAAGAGAVKGSNPRRVLAGRLNRQKRGGLTPEGREKLRQAALRNEPWRHATGPKTAEGKAAVARNGRARQKGRTSVRAARREARAVRNLIRVMREAREQQA
jgi:hypothetical protein